MSAEAEVTNTVHEDERKLFVGGLPQVNTISKYRLILTCEFLGGEGHGHRGVLQPVWRDREHQPKDGPKHRALPWVCIYRLQGGD